MHSTSGIGVDLITISNESVLILEGDSWLLRKRKARIADRYGEIDGSLGKRGLWLYLFNGWDV